MNANESLMSRRTALKLSASFTAAAACTPLRSVFADDDGPVAKVLFTNVNVFDGLSSTLAEGMNVLVEGNTIAAVSKEPIVVDSSTNSQIIDGGGRTLMPGLINCHVHMAMPDAIPNLENNVPYDEIVIGSTILAQGYIDDGFTTVRDMGGPTFGLKRTIDRGLIRGPRIYPSGAFISQTSGHFDLRNFTNQEKGESHLERIGLSALVDGRDEMLAAVRNNLRQGASQIKICAGGGAASIFDPIDVMQFTRDEIDAAVEAAGHWKTYVAAHIFTPEAIQICAAAGVKTFEHAFLIDDETTSMDVDEGLWLVPQINGLSPMLQQNPILGPASIAKIRQVQADSNLIELIEKHRPNVAFADDCFGLPEDVTRQRRFELGWRASLFGNFETLRQATSAAGELVALSGPRDPYPGKLGVIEEGALADILLVDGNPLNDIAAVGGSMKWWDGDTGPIDTLSLVMKDGKIHKNTIAA